MPFASTRLSRIGDWREAVAAVYLGMEYQRLDMHGQRGRLADEGL
jgi:hypothetical protein